MTIRHHVSDETIVAYASGALNEAYAVVVATHLTLCPGCAARAATAEAIGGALLGGLPASAIGDDALDRAMARLDEAAPPEPEPTPSDFPATLGHYALRPWRWLAPGIRLIPMLKSAGERAGLQLLRIAPGTALPLHGHRGPEFTCVLAGGFSDETGSYGPGDIAEMDGAVDHRPVADAGEDCICLVAIEGRLRFISPIARIMQLFIGI